jgi:hypothetical protein
MHVGVPGAQMGVPGEVDPVETMLRGGAGACGGHVGDDKDRNLVLDSDFAQLVCCAFDDPRPARCLDLEHPRLPPDLGAGVDIPVTRLSVERDRISRLAEKVGE